MYDRLVFGALASALALATPVEANAPGVELGATRFSVGVVGFVPVICRASLDAGMVPIGTGTAKLGTLNEFCNSPGGYRVVATYSPSLASGRLMVDGSAIELDGTGSVVVSQSDHAAMTNRDLSLELSQDVTSGSLDFRIEPL